NIKYFCHAILKSVSVIVQTMCRAEPLEKSVIILSSSVLSTNRNCEVTADVRHDGSEPLVDVMFADGDRLIMKGANLTTVEMLTALGSRCNIKELKAEQKSKKKNP
uniref:Large ribosomal subunit protein mL53 n=1 Tax=Anas platyrhynchos platyrhynchos TaxID=8840 RepID=A0A493T807_ANAPP